MGIDLKFETDDVRIELHWKLGSSYSTYVNVLDMRTGKHVILPWARFLEGILDLSTELVEPTSIEVKAPAGPGGIKHNE